MDEETRQYPDGPWNTGSFFAVNSDGKRYLSKVVVYGPDGDPILTCDCSNAAHLMTPRDVADYLMELKGQA